MAKAIAVNSAMHPTIREVGNGRIDTKVLWGVLETQNGQVVDSTCPLEARSNTNLALLWLTPLADGNPNLTSERRRSHIFVFVPQNLWPSYLFIVGRREPFGINCAPYPLERFREWAD